MFFLAEKDGKAYLVEDLKLSKESNIQPPNLEVGMLCIMLNSMVDKDE